MPPRRLSFSTDPVLSFSLYGEGPTNEATLSELSSQKRSFAAVLENEAGNVEYRDNTGCG